jgi:TRAP-type C4-dicarboxylate transport system permease small subunit
LISNLGIPGLILIFFLLIIVFGVSIALFTGKIANSKNRDYKKWVILGFLFGFFSLIILLLLPKLKKCPKCSNSINIEALVCHYCYHDFVKSANQSGVN